MTAIPDLYAALGIDPSADPEVIAAAYRALAKKYHPDTGATTGTASAERFEQVQRAYEVLRSPESRRRYDLDLLAQAERDLEEHLARKRRALPGASGSARSLKGPDLGAIRPEPASAAPRGRGPLGPQPMGSRRSLAPFLIPGVLFLALLGAAAWLFIPNQRETPAVTMAGTTAPAADPPALTPAAPAAPAAPKSDDSASATGQAGAETASAKADAEPATAPPATVTPTAAPPEDEPGQTPVFGTSEPEEADAGTATTTAAMPVPVPPPPTPTPTPKPRPAKQNTAAAKPPAAKPPAAPRMQAEAASAYTLTIFERKRRGGIRSRQADMLFATRGSCVEFGVRAVLRRMEARNMNPRRQRIWYECEPAF